MVCTVCDSLYISIYMYVVFLLSAKCADFYRISKECVISRSMALLQLFLNYPHPDYLYPNTWTSADVATFSAAVGKRRCGHWSFATGEIKAAV